MKLILVIGATGTIGRQVVSQLIAANVSVRALARNPDSANLPAQVEIVRGDLTIPDTLDQSLNDADAVFLVWTAPATAVASALARIAKHVPRIVFLSAPHQTAHPFFQQPNPVATMHKEIERLIEASGLQWTFLRPGMFAANCLPWWVLRIRAGNVVRWPYAQAPTAPIHERDIAAVAVRMLCEEGHGGEDYVLTGPQSLSQSEQVGIIGEVIGRTLHFEEISPEEAQRELLTVMPPPAINMLLNAWAAAIGQPAFITSAVAEITGTPARTFRDWVSDHAASFGDDQETMGGFESRITMSKITSVDIRKTPMLRHLINSIPVRTLILLALICGTVAPGGIHAQRQAQKQTQKVMGGRTVRLFTRDGKVLEGRLSAGGFTVNGSLSRSVSVETLLSINLAADASSRESERITADLAAVQGADRAARDTAVAELTDIGLPALTPVLNAYKDRDLREPDALYRLFARLMPGYADAADRSLDFIRLKSGDAIRGRVGLESLAIQPPGGSEMKVPLSSIRSLAMRQAMIEKSFEVHALRHCTQIEFLDTGVIIGPNSRVEATAAGYVRLSFAIDGWASDPDGLKVPGPNYKTNLVDGFPFGALVGKVGTTGPRFIVGHHLDKTGLGEGRLYLAVNDNGHWQNNIGSFRVKLRVSEAYDVGDPQ